MIVSTLKSTYESFTEIFSACSVVMETSELSPVVTEPHFLM